MNNRCNEEHHTHTDISLSSSSNIPIFERSIMDKQVKVIASNKTNIYIRTLYNEEIILIYTQV